MKNLRLLLVVGIALLLGGQSLYAQKTSKKEQRIEEVKEQIESGSFMININRAIPLQGRAVNLTSPYSLEIKGDTVISYLPYFGRAYNIPYGGGKGLRFEEEMSGYSSSINKKGTHLIKFSVQTDEDRYTFNVQIYSNGNTVVIVQPVNRQGITFQGEIASRDRQ